MSAPNIKILVVEDDGTLLSVLQYNLSKEGYEVVTASDGPGALDVARKDRPDFIILDLMLPTLSGLEVARILRKEVHTPILILTARGDESDKIKGLELGADDYVTKPFKMGELLARVKAILRRSGSARMVETAEQKTFQVGDIAVDTARHTVLRKASPVELTPKEFDLLVFLIRNRGLVFSRERLLDEVWGADYPGGTRTVDVHIRWLREKLEEDASNPRYLLTVRGVGYKVEG